MGGGVVVFSPTVRGLAFLAKRERERERERDEMRDERIKEVMSQKHEF